MSDIDTLYVLAGASTTMVVFLSFAVISLQSDISELREAQRCPVTPSQVVEIAKDVIADTEDAALR